MEDMTEISNINSSKTVNEPDLDPNFDTDVSVKVADVTHERKEAEYKLDEKILQFCTVLYKYQMKCEFEGKYHEADRAHKQLHKIKTKEINRQMKALRLKQMSERTKLNQKHNNQIERFNQTWTEYLEKYNNLANQYLKELEYRHNKQMETFIATYQAKQNTKPKKYSKELLEWRRRETLLAKGKNYTEAQKIKKVGDILEARERSRINNLWKDSFENRKQRLLNKQENEKHVLQKRINIRRKEHLAHRKLDLNKLKQRHRNLNRVMESKHSIDKRNILAEIKARLAKLFTIEENDSAGVSNNLEVNSPLVENEDEEESNSKIPFDK